MAAKVPTLLPHQPEPIVGRDAELRAIYRRFVDLGARMVTLTGPAGTGKTRLAIAAGELLANATPGRPIFVDLAPMGDWRLVLPAIAHSLGLRRLRSRSALPAVIDALQAEPCLLLLDNLEHLLNAAPQLAELLSACADVKILVTSREPLRIRWEQVLPILPLRLPDAADLSDREEIANTPAVALFVQRAAAIQPEFSLTDDNCRDVAEICTRLDGLPLAIELAAARADVLTPAEMVRWLDRRLDLLNRGERDRPARHQALRSAIDWSCALLDPAERSLFRRLGVYATGCTLEGAAAVADTGMPEAQVLDIVTALCNKSLLQRQDPAGEQPRFRMLETMREYALEELAAADEVDEAAQCACQYYLELAEHAVSMIDSDERSMWIRRMELEHDNLRVSLQWLAGHGEPDAALQLGAYLAPFWSIWNRANEGRLWLSSLLALGDPDRASAERLAALKAAATLAREPGDDPAPPDPSGLTAREMDVLRLTAKGLTNKEIAQELVLSLPTVQTHLANIFRKIDVHSRAAATAYVLTQRLRSGVE